MTQPSNRFALSACALAASLLVAACGGGGNDASITDTVAPTLVIDDHITGAVSRGAVTFIFSFSESVGTSFTAADIVVAGGEAGTLIKVNDMKYLLEVTPPQKSTGTVSVSVAAGVFTDLSGKPNAAAAAHSQDFDTVPPPPPPPVGGDVVLASFEGDTASLQFAGFNGAETSTIAAGPAGGTGNAGKIIRLGGEVWAGAKANVGVIPLTATNRTISARVHSAVAGVPMVLKLENATNPDINTGDIQATQTVVVGWQTLTWVVPEGKVGPEYSWVVMLPNLNTKASTDPGETYYFDDIKLVVPPAPSDLVLTSFEGDTASLQFTGFNGAETSTIAAGPAGGSGNAGKIIRLGGEVWAGAKANVGVIPLTASNRTISARVHSAVAGVPMVLKLENATNPDINTGDIQATQTVVVGWQTLTWVVPEGKVGPEYSWVVMLPNLNTKASTDPGETYYFDDIKLLIAPPPTATVLTTFEEEASTLQFTGFNGAETSSIAAGPAGGTGLAGKIIRLGGEVWAGAKVNVGVIPLTASRRTISARVHSAVAGVPMVLKLENATNPDINTGDIQATQTVVVGWQTLTWVVPEGKVGPEYSWVVMLPNLNTKASADPGETYYFDDIKLVDGP